MKFVIRHINHENAGWMWRKFLLHENGEEIPQSYAVDDQDIPWLAQQCGWKSCRVKGVIWDFCHHNRYVECIATTRECCFCGAPRNSFIESARAYLQLHEGLVMDEVEGRVI